MASFSNQAKTEICGTIRKAADRRAFLIGILLSARRKAADTVTLQTECTAFAELLPQLLRTVTPAPDFDTEYRKRSGRQPLWTFTVSGAEQIAALHRALQIDCADSEKTLSQLSGKAFAMAMAGCFVICGSVTDPERGYHLELVMPDAALGTAIQTLLPAYQPGIALKATVRKGDPVLYLKQNEMICDALTLFGAQNASMALAEQQVYKSIRSQTNRRTNCDLANIDKTIAAGAQQAADILRIQQTVGLESLPETLQEIARVRLAEPEANLRDLGAMCKPPLSRSGVHHRLQRIAAIAKKLEESPMKEE